MFKFGLLSLILIFSFSCTSQKEFSIEHKTWNQWTKNRAFSTAHYGSTICHIWNGRAKKLFLIEAYGRCSFEKSQSDGPYLGQLLFKKDHIFWIKNNDRKENLLEANNLFDLNTNENGPDFLKIAKTPVKKKYFLSAELWKAKGTNFSYFLSYHDTKKFKSLKERLNQVNKSYFKYNPSLNVTAQYTESNKIIISLQKSKKGTTKKLYKKGTLSFELKGQRYFLSVYSDEDGKIHKHLMFQDLTSGTSTFGGGRYLNTPDLNSSNIKVDFNYSKNPMCAYTSAWNCTVPDDSLQVAIKAGEKYLKN